MIKNYTNNQLLDLKDSTFIIPLRIDSDDRKNNLMITTKYLLNNFDASIIILEADHSPQAKGMIDERIKYIFYEDNNDFFHRTKFLNIMLNETKTSCVINYDIDVLLPVGAYTYAYNLIKNDQADLVYPFEYGKLQHEINSSGKNKFKKKFLV